MTHNKLQFWILIIWSFGFAVCLSLVARSYYLESAGYTLTDKTISYLQDKKVSSNAIDEFRESMLDVDYKNVVELKSSISQLAHSCVQRCISLTTKYSKNEGYGEYVNLLLKVYIPWLTIMFTSFLTLDSSVKRNIDNGKVIITISTSIVYQLAAIGLIALFLFKWEMQDNNLPEVESVIATSIIAAIINFVFPRETNESSLEVVDENTPNKAN